MVQNELPSTECESFIMTLDSICPPPPTDMDALALHLKLSDEPVAALPATLPDQILLSVARDLRMLNEIDQDDERNSVFLTAPLMLLASLHFSVAKNNEGALIGEGSFYKSMMVYQWATEREIVRRIACSSECEDKETLIREFEKISQSSDSAST